MARRAPCVDPAHTQRGAGGQCLVCKGQRQRERQAARRTARGEVLLLPPGKTYQSAAMSQAWETRRARYGPRGVSDDGEARMVSALERQRHPRSVRCKRGHLLTPENVSQGGKGRMCRRCNIERARAWRARQRSVRPEWVVVGKVRVNLAAHDAFYLDRARRLYAAMLAEHPDRHPGGRGGATRFIQARRRWDAFYAAEQAWYAAAGVDMPEGVRGVARGLHGTSTEAHA